mmetsp:Transcript_23422/g.54082  ORF Transcript_23422/g.54082 Transcript_23422/m.54082 type:complete len:201 (-) Transcript_23422:473-1075(-)
MKAVGPLPGSLDGQILITPSSAISSMPWLMSASVTSIGKFPMNKVLTPAPGAAAGGTCAMTGLAPTASCFTQPRGASSESCTPSTRELTLAHCPTIICPWTTMAPAARPTIAASASNREPNRTKPLYDPCGDGFLWTVAASTWPQIEKASARSASCTPSGKLPTQSVVIGSAGACEYGLPPRCLCEYSPAPYMLLKAGGP